MRNRIMTASSGLLPLLLASVVLLSAAQGGKTSWNFDKDNLGGLAQGFTSEVGEWKSLPMDLYRALPS